MNKQIGPFTIDLDKTTMEYGTYYKALLDVPFASTKRYIRVWLPEEYDFNNTNKKFPVIYFSDGQNLFNEYLTAFGSWNLDKVAHNLISNDISFIAVGIDSPRDDKMRENELSPFMPTITSFINDPKCGIFVKYIVDELKPLIDFLFNTKREKASTAIAGSSMGGLMSFYAVASYPNIFGFAYVFSPAFLLYNEKTWKKILDGLKLSKDEDIKLFLYVGGLGFEEKFINRTVMTYKYLRRKSFDEKHLVLIVDSSMPHHEKAWNKYFASATLFWLKGE